MRSEGTAREIARRLRERIPPVPVFTRDIQPCGPEGFVVITSIGRKVAG